MENTVGSRIKMLRNITAMTQLELAAKLNISNTTLSQYESGVRSPSYEILTSISDIFGVPTDYILGSGIFKNWASILKNRDRILEVISTEASHLAESIKVGVDDITLAKLVYAFDVKVTDRVDGLGISLKNPFPTYPQESLVKKECPLTVGQGDGIVQSALRGTGLLSEDGSLAPGSEEVISDFLSRNADILKQLVRDKK